MRKIIQSTFSIFAGFIRRSVDVSKEESIKSGNRYLAFQWTKLMDILFAGIELVSVEQVAVELNQAFITEII